MHEMYKIWKPSHTSQWHASYDDGGVVGTGVEIEDAIRDLMRKSYEAIMRQYDHLAALDI